MQHDHPISRFGIFKDAVQEFGLLKTLKLVFTGILSSKPCYKTGSSDTIDTDTDESDNQNDSKGPSVITYRK